LGVDRLYFHRARSHRPPTRVIIALDSSGSMDSARLHAVLMAAVLTRIPHLDPRLLLFDTRVMDVSDQLQDPVGLLLGTRLGAGRIWEQPSRRRRASPRIPGAPWWSSSRISSREAH